jgi:putative heme-binding domain-containing protein
MWLDGSLYVAAPPHIWKLTDTTGDGRADTREIWFDGKTLTGCANDLHGPYRGPDGYIYWAKGAFAKQEHTLANGKPFTTRAAHLFRAKPDGSGLEPVMTGGMDNPVDIVFTPGGERIFSTTFFQHPADGKRDGLIHAVYGGIYGKDHDPIYDPVHKWTAPQLMPVLTHMGPAAPCGLHRYESDQFGPEYRDNIFCCQFNLRTVSRHVLLPKGSTFETKDSPFVTSDDVDFHPTDVLEDADGSLLVIDTGGWYMLCCPSSQLVKADVTGGIYRVRKTGSHTTRTKPAPQPLPELYWISLRRERAGLDTALAGLTNNNLHTRRLAAEALGRIGDPTAVPAILTAIADEQNDRVLDHSLTYALIEIGDPTATAAGLTHSSPRVKRAVLASLDQMDGGKLSAKDVLPHLTAADPALKETAWWIAGRHPEWGNLLIDHFRERLSGNLNDSERDELADRIGRFAANEVVQKWLATAAAGDDLRAADTAFRVMARARLKETPQAWIDATVAALGRVPSAVTAARTFTGSKERLAKLTEVLVRLGSEPGSFDMLLAVPGGLSVVDDRTFQLILTRFTRDKDPVAVEVLSRATLTPAQLTAVAQALKAAGPLEVGKLLTTFTKSTDEGVGRALVEALSTPAVRATLRTDQVQPILDKYPPSVRKQAESLYAELDKARADEKQRLEAIFNELPSGDIYRGQVIFNSTKAACITCHKIGYVGGTVGPDLTKIGSIRTERDLLDSILFPSAAIVRGYESVRVSTLDGQEFNGILKKDAPDEVVLVLSADKEVRIARDDIEAMQPGTVSVMPAGLDQQLTRQELADLLAFLRACK